MLAAAHGGVGSVALVAGGVALGLLILALILGGLLVHWLHGPEEWPDLPPKSKPGDDPK